MTIDVAIKRADRDIARWLAVIKNVAAALSRDMDRGEIDHTLDQLADARISLARARAVREALGALTPGAPSHD